MTRRVLVADDEPLVRQVVCDILRSGYAIETAESGHDVLRLYHEGQYDLLILDSGMRSLSGMEVVTRVREGGDRIPIILMTGAPEGVPKVGSFAFTYRIRLLRKPFGVQELRTAVDEAVPA